jgi:hypothetical protein
MAAFLERLARHFAWPRGAGEAIVRIEVAGKERHHSR